MASKLFLMLLLLHLSNMMLEKYIEKFGMYHLAHKKRGSVFLAYLQFFSSKSKKSYEFCGENQIV